MLFQVLRTLTLLALYGRGLDHLYAQIYYYLQIPELLLLLGVSWEITLHVLRPDGRWSWGVRAPFVLAAAGGIVLALVMTFVMHPKLPHTFFGWFYPSDLFCSCLLFELSVAILLTAARFGLAWRNRVFGLASGWTILNLIWFLSETGRNYFPMARISSVFVQIRMYAYLVVVAYWINAFWRREPVRRPMTLQMKTVFSSTVAEISGKGNK